MAHLRQVVGNVANPTTRVVITELNIETPVQPIFDFPMTSNRQRDPLGVGGPRGPMFVKIIESSSFGGLSFTHST